jgi:hypothetical protein
LERIVWSLIPEKESVSTRWRRIFHKLGRDRRYSPGIPGIPGGKMLITIRIKRVLCTRCRAGNSRFRGECTNQERTIKY